MAVEGGLKCIKYLMFIFNFIFSLCGLALIVVGALVQVSLHKTLMINDASASGAPIVIIAIGVIVFLVAFFGCCGAWKESFCMITTYAILIGLIIIIEVAAAITGYVYRDKVKTVVQGSLTDMITQYNNSSKEFRDTVDYLQQKLNCCGVNSSVDWKSFSPEGHTVPDSCCITVINGCGIGTMNDGSHVFQEGCQTAVDTFLTANVQWVIVASLAIAAVQIFGLVFACLLMRGIRRGYEVTLQNAPVTKH